MPDCTPESTAAQATALPEAADRSPAAVEEKVVRLFDEVRVPLLRYLSAFPLGMADSEDVVQEAFLSLFRSLQDGNHPQNPRGWLFRAAHHLALKKRQRSRRDPESVECIANIDAVAIDPALGPEDQMAFKQSQQRMQSVVRALPERFRWCLYLRAEGLRYREIAEVVGISLGSVSQYLERSLALIGRAVQR